MAKVPRNKTRSNAAKGLPPYNPKAPRRTLKRLPAEAAKKPTGRPPTYKPEYDELSMRLKLLGLTDEEIAKSIGISIKEMKVWDSKYPSFRATRDEGGDAADARVAQSLYHRALGYKHKAVKIMNVNGVVQHEEYTAHYPPDTRAAEIWLTNRRSKLWKNTLAREDETDKTVTVKIVGGLPE